MALAKALVTREVLSNSKKTEIEADVCHGLVMTYMTSHMTTHTMERIKIRQALWKGSR